MLAKPKKSLGQNFLIDKNIQKKIISACAFDPDDIILEIGSGRGELTAQFAQIVSQIFAVELDSDLCKCLKSRFEGYQNVKIINKDILKIDLAKLFRAGKKVKILGNIPYYISSPIIEHLLKFRERIDSIFITVQKEFGKRVAASAGSKDYGSFSCFVQYHTEPKILFYIKSSSFSPSPKVDSCFLRLKIRTEKAVRAENEEFLFKVIRSSFGKRRKTLRNSLSGIIPAEKLERFFAIYGIDRNIRPEQLKLSDFANLANS